MGKEKLNMEFFETVEKRASYRHAFAEKDIPEEEKAELRRKHGYAPDDFIMLYGNILPIL